MSPITRPPSRSLGEGWSHLFRFPNSDFARLKVDFIEPAGLQVPNRVQLSAPNRTGSKIGFVRGPNVEQELVALEFKILELRIVGHEKVTIVRFLWIFLQKPVLPIAIEILHDLRPNLRLFAFDF